MRFDTKAVHAGQNADAASGDTIPAIHVSTTYTQGSVGGHKGFEYSRTGNPTRAALETLVACLEDAAHGIAFASGMAATHAVLMLAKEGSHVVLSTDVYGGTYRLLDKLLDDRGLDYSMVDTTDLDSVRGAMRPETRILFVETPTNPLLKVMDISALKEAVGADVRLVVDNTFATPCFQRPLALGADVVVHSSTKYLGGHSDAVGGVAVTNDDQTAEMLRFVQNGVGAVPSPFDCYLVTRGIKTLPLRMKAHEANGLAVARFLLERPDVAEVFHPCVASKRDRAIASRQTSGAPGMVSFRIRGGGRAAESFLENLSVFSLAESLGGVESLACLPAAMTHECFGRELRQQLGITPDLVRLSVGIEDENDLIEDLEQALDKASEPSARPNSSARSG